MGFKAFLINYISSNIIFASVLLLQRYIGLTTLERLVLFLWLIYNIAVIYVTYKKSTEWP